MSTAPPEWFDSGLCAQTDPELFFPEKGASNAAGKRICRACPFTAECLAWALETDQRHGIWGGLSETERRPLARRIPYRAQRSPCGTAAGYRSHYRHKETPCVPCREADALRRKIAKDVA